MIRPDHLNWRSFIRWSPDHWVSQCYAIECEYKLLLCTVLRLYDSRESMSNQPARWTPVTYWYTHRYKDKIAEMAFSYSWGLKTCNVFKMSRCRISASQCCLHMGTWGCEDTSVVHGLIQSRHKDEPSTKVIIYFRAKCVCQVWVTLIRV
jgi:hypothetical protein